MKKILFCFGVILVAILNVATFFGKKRFRSIKIKSEIIAVQSVTSSADGSGLRDNCGVTSCTLA